MPKRVLIVDPDDFACRAVERMLTMYEYEIDAVDDAETALMILPYALPDLVIAVYPSKVPGGSFVRQVKRFAPQAFVLALVPERLRHLADAARIEGYPDVLTKPINPEALSRALRTTIGAPEPWPLSAEH